MVLHIDSFRPEKGGDLEGVRTSEKRRYADPQVVDKILEVDIEWRKVDFQSAEIRTLLNKLNSKVIKTKMIAAKKAKIDFATLPQTLPESFESTPVLEIPFPSIEELEITQLLEFKKKIDKEILLKKERLVELDTERQTLLRKVGNIVHDSVPVDDDEVNNEVYKTFGDCSTEKKYSHRDLIVMIDGVDLERGSIVAGGRGYYLKGAAVMLENALINYGLQLLYGKGYTPISPPVFMNKDIMQEVAQLSQFDEELYKVSGTGDAYLIATAEQPLAAYHRGDFMTPKELEEPIRYVGISNCFRKEVGSHGRDTAGIFRVHQFQKLEQFVITSPEENKSWEEMEKMIGNAETYFQNLNIPYRVVNMVSGELNLAAAKKYDLEAWFPGSKAYRELVSCSNCTDYQSRRLKIRYGEMGQKTNVPQFVHMLNSTLCATTRGICAILENNQTETGIVVPEALYPYLPKSMHGEIPFVKPAPIDLEAAAAAKPSKNSKKGN